MMLNIRKENETLKQEVSTLNTKVEALQNKISYPAIDSEKTTSQNVINSE